MPSYRFKVTNQNISIETLNKGCITWTKSEVVFCAL